VSPELGLEAQTGSQPSIASIQHEVFVGQPGKIVLILCEENHASLEVQRNCKLAIETLMGTGIRAALLAEGTTPKRIDLSKVFAAGAPSFRLAVAEAWFELGWLSGVEMAALQDPTFPLFGVEEPDSLERIAHRQALNSEYWAWRDLCNTLNSLLKGLSDQISLDCTERGAQRLKFPQEAGQQFPQIATALERAQQVEAAFEQPVEDALPLEEAVDILQREISRGKSIREALATLQWDFPGARATFSTRFARWETALDALYATIIETAQRAGLDVALAQQRRQTYQQRRAEANAARSARHGPMIANAQQALNSVAFEVGILKIGAGHIAQLKELLRGQGISYLVITPEPPGLRFLTTPWRELNWFSRNQRGEKTPLESWLGVFGNELTLANPKKQDTLATDIALAEAISRALRGEPVDVPSGLKGLEVRRLPNRVEIRVEGLSGRWLYFQFPPTLRELTPIASKELAGHLFEALEAGTRLMRRADGFFSPVVRIYLEPLERGFGGGAFISFRPEEGILFTQIVPFKSAPDVTASISEIVELYKKAIAKPLSGPDKLELTKESIRNRQPSILFAPLAILDPIVRALNPILRDLGLPEDQIIPIALPLAPLPGKSISPLREVDFTVLAMLARLAGVEEYERRLIFVKSGLEADSDRIKVGRWERLLNTTLENIHLWAPTSKHIAVFTVPTAGTEEEWAKNPFAKYLTKRWIERGPIKTDKEALKLYQDEILPSIKRAIEALDLSGENVIEPLTIDDFFQKLGEKTGSAPDATITITLVAHRKEDQGPVIHFKEQPDVPLKEVLDELKRLQDEGKLPGPTKLEFNVLVCSIGKEGADGFLKRLRARLVLATTGEIDLATGSELLARLARKMREEGKALYQAHFEAQEEVLIEILEKRIPEGVRSLEMPWHISKKSGSSTNL